MQTQNRQETSSRAGSPSFPHPSPQLCIHQSNYSWIYSHPSISSGCPAPFPSQCPLSSIRPSKAPSRYTHPPTWAESGDPSSRSTLRSSASSSTNALGLFLHLPASRGGWRDLGRHRKVSLSHLCAARHAPGSSEVEQRRGPRARGPGLQGPQRSALCLSAHRAALQGLRGTVRASGVGMACSRRLAVLPSPSSPSSFALASASPTGAGRDLRGAVRACSLLRGAR